MRIKPHLNQQEMDPYFHEECNIVSIEKEKYCKQNELAKRHFKPRMTVHPRFQNITADEAMELFLFLLQRGHEDVYGFLVQLLADKEPRDSIFRPSSCDPSFFTLALKICDGVYAHKDIIEGAKEHKDITSLLRIGKDSKYRGGRI